MDVTSPTRIVDRVSESLPYLYFSSRCGMLGLTFVALGFWAVTGFNIVEGAVPLIGIQFSTVATFTFFFYLMMMNLQVGGLRSFSQLQRNIKQDIWFLFSSLAHPRGRIREVYPAEGSIDALRAAGLSLLVCIAALFAFESIWVPLYDFFQFGSLLWPVYFATTTVPVIIRNMGLSIIPFVLIPILFAITLDTPIKQRFSVRWRIDFGFAWLVFIAFAFWLNWIIFPHQPFPISQLDYGTANQVIGPTAITFNPLNCYVFPSQHFFPQNTYTFYPCNLQGMSYTPPQILGFFDADPWVHLINVLTKVATFAAVCYPAMAFVKRKT